MTRRNNASRAAAKDSKASQMKNTPAQSIPAPSTETTTTQTCDIPSNTPILETTLDELPTVQKETSVLTDQEQEQKDSLGKQADVAVNHDQPTQAEDSLLLSPCFLSLLKDKNPLLYSSLVTASQALKSNQSDEDVLDQLVESLSSLKVSANVSVDDNKGPTPHQTEKTTLPPSDTKTSTGNEIENGSNTVSNEPQHDSESEYDSYGSYGSTDDESRSIYEESESENDYDDENNDEYDSDENSHEDIDEDEQDHAHKNEKVAPAPAGRFFSLPSWLSRQANTFYRTRDFTFGGYPIYLNVPLAPPQYDVANPTLPIDTDYSAYSDLAHTPWNKEGCFHSAAFHGTPSWKDANSKGFTRIYANLEFKGYLPRPPIQTIYRPLAHSHPSYGSRGVSPPEFTERILANRARQLSILSLYHRLQEKEALLAKNTDSKRTNADSEHPTERGSAEATSSSSPSPSLAHFSLDSLGFLPNAESLGDLVCDEDIELSEDDRAHVYQTRLAWGLTVRDQDNYMIENANLVFESDDEFSYVSSITRLLAKKLQLKEKSKHYRSSPSHASVAKTSILRGSDSDDVDVDEDNTDNDVDDVDDVDEMKQGSYPRTSSSSSSILSKTTSTSTPSKSISKQTRGRGRDRLPSNSALSKPPALTRREAELKALRILLAAELVALDLQLIESNSDPIGINLADLQLDSQSLTAQDVDVPSLAQSIGFSSPEATKYSLRPPKARNSLQSGTSSATMSAAITSLPLLDRLHEYLNSQETKQRMANIPPFFRQTIKMSVHLNLPISFEFPLRSGLEPGKELRLERGQMIAGRYRIVRKIGSAAFSQALDVYDTLSNQHICLKIMNNEKDLVDQGLDEVKVLRLLNSYDPNDEFHIVNLRTFFYAREHLFIGSELLGSNLYKVCQQVWSPIESQRAAGLPGNFFFSLRQIRKIARQLLISLWYLRCFGILHCDVKPENIVIDDWDKGSVKLIDFGSICFLHDDALTSYVQSRSYRAPEVILGLDFTTPSAVDMWSLGCVLYELYTNQIMFTPRALPVILARMISFLGPIPREMILHSPFNAELFREVVVADGPSLLLPFQRRLIGPQEISHNFASYDGELDVDPNYIRTREIKAILKASKDAARALRSRGNVMDVSAASDEDFGFSSTDDSVSDHPQAHSHHENGSQHVDDEHYHNHEQEHTAKPVVDAVEAELENAILSPEVERELQRELVELELELGKKAQISLQDQSIWSDEVIEDENTWAAQDTDHSSHDVIKSPISPLMEDCILDPVPTTILDQVLLTAREQRVLYHRHAPEGTEPSVDDNCLSDDVARLTCDPLEWPVPKLRPQPWESSSPDRIRAFIDARKNTAPLNLQANGKAPFPKGMTDPIFPANPAFPRPAFFGIHHPSKLIPHDSPALFANFLSQLLRYDPKQRPTPEQALLHPFLWPVHDDEEWDL